MPRRDEIAGRMADAVVKRLTTRKVLDIRDEPAARAAIQIPLVREVLGFQLRVGDDPVAA